MAVNPIPQGYHSVTPYLIVREVPKLLDFLKQAFNAQEIMRLPQPDGTIMHAEVRIGDSAIMMGEAQGEHKPMPGSIYLYVDDMDAAYKRALQAGATVQMEPANQFWGDRTAWVMDPSGHVWTVATRVEETSEDKRRKRWSSIRSPKT